MGLFVVSAKWSYVTASPSHHDQAIPILSPLLFMHVGHPYIPLFKIRRIFDLLVTCIAIHIQYMYVYKYSCMLPDNPREHVFNPSQLREVCPSRESSERDGCIQLQQCLIISSDADKLLCWSNPNSVDKQSKFS